MVVSYKNYITLSLNLTVKLEVKAKLHIKKYQDIYSWGSLKKRKKLGKFPKVREGGGGKNKQSKIKFF